MSEALEVLLKARALIENPKRWTKHEYRSEDGALCATEALREVARLFTPARTRSFQALASALPEPFVGIINFNDDPNTTHEDVLALFDTAIFLELEPKES